MKPLLAVGVALLTMTTLGVAATSAYRLSFDSDAMLPPGWRADATGGKPADWKVGTDPRAASAPHTLTIARLNDRSRGNFNLFWSPDTRFRDGDIEVSIRADGGAIDRGGGLIWRAQDADNYYVARYNPLERNLRLYYVKDGIRRLLADAPDLRVGSGEWMRLKVAHYGARIEVFLNGSRLISTSDTVFAAPGGVGLWTKADAQSSFDDLTIQPSP